MAHETSLIIGVWRAKKDLKNEQTEEGLDHNCDDVSVSRDQSN